MSLIVTGSIGIDSVETPTGAANDVLGGSCIYFAAAASYFTPVRVVGAVGEDFPDTFLKTFAHFNIDTRGLEKRKGSKTFRWKGKYLANMDDRETVSVDLNVLAEALPRVPHAYRDSKFIFLANTDPGSQIALLDQFPNRKLAVADTMDLWIKTQRDKLGQLLQKLDGIVLNDSEAILLTDETNMIRAAEEIAAMGPKFVVIKKGQHGALMHHSKGQISLPAFPARDVVDPTGAGDSFAGGMMGYLAALLEAENREATIEDLKHAMAYGTIIASFNIEAFSLERLKQVTRKDVDLRLGLYRAMLAMKG